VTKRIAYLIVMGFVLCLSVGLTTLNAQESTLEGSYATVGDLEMYYEIHGEGEPLILLHGGLGGIVEFSQVLPVLAETRQVIAVELQGHGRTADIDRPRSYETMADDVAGFIEFLGLENADIMGYSLGGGVALQTAILHPEVVNRLILISVPFRRSAIHPEFLQGMEAMNADAATGMLETPVYQFYSSVAPSVEDWSTLVGKVGNMLRQDYDWSEDVSAITAPTLITLGDSDYFVPSHAVEFFELLGGGVPGGYVDPPNAQLAVLPGVTHFDIVYRPDLLLPVVTAFLETTETAAAQ
jgi:pimeloyl-ACP methyl ester carboxylesterase